MLKKRGSGSMESKEAEKWKEDEREGVEEKDEKKMQGNRNENIPPLAIARTHGCKHPQENAGVVALCCFVL